MSMEKERVDEFLKLIKPVSLGMQVAGGAFVGLAWTMADPSYRYDSSKFILLSFLWLLSLLGSWSTRHLSYFSILTVWLVCYGFILLMDPSPNSQYWAAVLGVAVSLVVAPVFSKLHEYVIVACGTWIIFGQGALVKTPHGGDAAWIWLLMISVVSVGMLLNLIFAKIHRQSLLLRNELEELAFTDVLTGINNRRKFLDDVQKVHGTISAGAGSFFMIDIDNFKSINDDFGHPKGDEVLQQVAQIIGDSVQFEPFGRMGGEEFGILLTWGGLDRAKDFGGCILEKTRKLEVFERKITVSVGVAMIKNGQSISALMKEADSCLYAAKHGGKDCLVIN